MSPGQLSTSAHAAGVPWPRTSAHPRTAATAWITTSRMITGPKRECHRASASAPIARSMMGARDIKASITAMP